MQVFIFFCVRMIMEQIPCTSMKMKTLNNILLILKYEIDLINRSLI